MNFRKGNKTDLIQLKELGVKSWTQFKQNLDEDSWLDMHQTLVSLDTYSELLEKSECMVCENEARDIIGMAFLVPKGNPNEIYEENWCQLRFVSVDPDYRGHRIGESLTQMCIELAVKNNEQIMALHTSEIMENAIHIYKKMGFKLLRHIEPRYGIQYWLFTLDLVSKVDN